MSANDAIDFYKILDIPKTASQEDIRKAYRKKSLTLHPDKGGDEGEFKKLNSAYEVLSDIEKRKNYDNPPSAFPFPPDIFGMFSNMFGGNGIPNMSTIKRKCEPVLHNYEVSLEDLCSCKIVKLKFLRDRRCICVCKKCKGSGKLTTTRAFAPNMYQQFVTVCEDCSGNGKKIGCNECKNGITKEVKFFDVFLKPEMEDGYKYIFKDEGNEGISTEAGDFTVIIKHKKHPVFEFENGDLIHKKNISLKDALCGHSFVLSHPNGENINIKCPEIVSPKSSVKIVVNKGMTENRSLRIFYTIDFPSELTDEQKIVLENIF